MKGEALRAHVPEVAGADDLVNVLVARLRRRPKGLLFGPKFDRQVTREQRRRRRIRRRRRWWRRLQTRRWQSLASTRRLPHLPPHQALFAAMGVQANRKLQAERMEARDFTRFPAEATAGREGRVKATAQRSRPHAGARGAKRPPGPARAGPTTAQGPDGPAGR